MMKTSKRFYRGEKKKYRQKDRDRDRDIRRKTVKRYEYNKKKQTKKYETSLHCSQQWIIPWCYCNNNTYWFFNDATNETIFR